MPSIYRTPEGRKAMMEDDANLAAREQELLVELEEVRTHRRLFAGYMIELGMTPPPTHPAMTATVVGSSHGALAGVARAPVTRPPKTWPEFILAALAQARWSYDTKEFMALAKGTIFEERFAVQPNGFYNARSLLEKRGLVVVLNRRMYLGEIYDQIQQGVISEDEPDLLGKRERIPDLILEVLRQRPRGLDTGGVMEALKLIPEARERAETNPGLIYTHLTKLRRSGKIITENSVNKLPEHSAHLSQRNVTLFPMASTGGSDV